MAKQGNHESGYKKRQARILSGNPGPRQMYVPFGSPAAVRPASIAEIRAYQGELRQAETEATLEAVAQ
jgi:hypothetical protein